MVSYIYGLTNPNVGLFFKFLGVFSPHEFTTSVRLTYSSPLALPCDFAPALSSSHNFLFLECCPFCSSTI